MNREAAAGTVVIGEEAAVAAPSEVSGIRAGATVFVGIGLTNVGNYAFQLLAARHLGPSSYSDVATLAALLATASLPLGAIQIFVARHVAAEASRGKPLNSDGYVSRFGAAVAVAGIAFTGVLLCASPLIQDALSIQDGWAVVFAALFIAPSFLTPILLGAAQGRQRFRLVAVAITVPAFLRVLLTVLAFAAGFGAAGALAATFCSALAGCVLPIWKLHDRLGPLRIWHPSFSRPDLLSLLPVAVGLLAITALSTDDVVVAKAAFTSHEAGLYGSASLVGRLILYLPAAIVTVLLPKVSSRVAANIETKSILRQSLFATAAFCIAATAVYAAMPHLVVSLAFGEKYKSSASLLWLFGVAMTCYALLNVVLTYQLGHGASRTSWFLLAGAVAEAALFAAFHQTPRQLLASSIGVGMFLLLANEVLIAPSVLRSLRSRDP